MEFRERSAKSIFVEELSDINSLPEFCLYSIGDFIENVTEIIIKTPTIS